VLLLYLVKYLALFTQATVIKIWKFMYCRKQQVWRDELCRFDVNRSQSRSWKVKSISEWSKTKK